MTSRLSKIITISTAYVLIAFGAHAEVLFRGDFNEHTAEWVGQSLGHHVAGSHGDNVPGTGVPIGWTGYIQYGNTDIRIQPGVGRGGTSALRIGPEWPGTANQVGLVVYLPKIVNGEEVYDGSGYDELYVRFYVRYSPNFQWNSTYVYQKWLRFWQNVPLNRIYGLPAGPGEPDQGMSKEENTGYILSVISEDQYGEYSPYFADRWCMDFAGESSSGPYVKNWSYEYTDNGGFIENAYGNIGSNGYFEDTVKSQAWHCWEFHVKLASSWEAGDGIYEIWLDGVKQQGTTTSSGAIKYPTPRLGSGINYITLHDNAAAYGWSEQAYVYVDDVVISTEYIGPSAASAGTPPSVSITTPSTPTHTTTSSTISISGTASDDGSVTSVTWGNSRGGSGTATGTTAWSASVPLLLGDNVITVTATDNESNTATDVITVTRSDTPVSSGASGSYSFH